jgi:3-phosphoshikimate 1-carboxyvinyltransferase
VASQPLDARVRLPGSKSLTARYLVLAALANGPSLLRGVLDARDSQLMGQALAALGASFDRPAPDAVRVLPAPPSTRPGRARPRGATRPAAGAVTDAGSGQAATDVRTDHAGADVRTGLAATDVQTEQAATGTGPGQAATDVRTDQAVIDVGLAGTVMRFAAPLAALSASSFTFTGDSAAAGRPIRPLLQALADLGAEVGWPPRGRSLPFSITGLGSLAGGACTLDARASSQFLSALLLAAPRFDQGLRVELHPPALPSRPHVDMTVRALTQFGAAVEQVGEWSWRVAPGGLAGQDLTVEPDLSNAGPFLAAALVAGGTVRVPGWPGQTDQPGDKLREYLEAFGGKVTWRPDSPPADRHCPDHGPSDGAREVSGELEVSGEVGALRGAHLNLAEAGELAPTLAALAALAGSESRLVGIGHLRGHETNRLAALTAEINRLGGDATELEGGLAIRPRPLHGGVVRTYGDHRMATFAALIGLAVPGVLIEDIGATAKTLPGFAALWQEMVAQ